MRPPELARALRYGSACKPITVPTPSRSRPCCPPSTPRSASSVIEQRADGLVAFEFAIGWPELAVELMLPSPAFAAFCAANRVQRLDA